MKDKGIAGRIGGDEFACIMHYDYRGDGNEVLKDIYTRFAEYNQFSEKSYNITVCAGIHILESHETVTLQEALTQADEKLYEVKKKRTKEVAKNLP